MAPKAEVLELDLNTLQSLLDTIQNGLGEEIAAPFRQLLDAYSHLLEIIGDKEISLAKLRRILFGSKTERSRDVLGSGHGASGQDQSGDGDKSPPNDSGPDNGVSGDSDKSPPIDSSPDNGVSGKTDADAPDGAANDGGSPPRKGHGRNGADAYTGCLKVFVPHASLSAGSSCPSCAIGVVYLQRTPRKLVRLIGQAPIGGTVYELERLRCNMCGAVFTADPPEGIGQDKYDATAVSMMALLRYGYGMPWNRSANLHQSMGVPLPPSTQWEVISPHADRITRVYEHLVQEAAQGDVVHNDDTPNRILELMNPKTREQALRDDDPDRSGIFTTGIVSVGNGHSISLFLTGPRHAGENLRDVLVKRAKELEAPIQMCDALSRNMPKELESIVANCLIHARRNFVEEVDRFPDEVAHVLDALKVVYRVDAQAKEEQLTPEERLALHQQQSGPVMEDLHRWLNDQFDQRKVEPNSSFGAAIRYMLKHWDRLTLFLRKPGAPLDNNICERALKKAILHRRNSLFYKTRRGAFVGDLFMSLIYTCFLCGVDAFDYLTQLLRNYKQAAETPASWMPWNYTTRDDPSRTSLATEGSPRDGPTTRNSPPIPAGHPSPDTS
jgi:transposase